MFFDWIIFLKILKRVEETSTDSTPKTFDRSDSTTSTGRLIELADGDYKQDNKTELKPKVSEELKPESTEVNEVLEDSSVSLLSSVPVTQNSDTLLHRTPSTTSYVFYFKIKIK